MTTVEEIMLTDVLKLPAETSISDAAKEMMKKEHRYVMVLTDDTAVGIVTSTDILYKIVAKGKVGKDTKIKDIMSTPLITVTPDTDLHEAAQIMTKNRIKKLPVAKAGELMGMVTATELVERSKEYTDVLVNLAVAGIDKVRVGE
jgi:CBS domain-containing protein